MCVDVWMFSKILSLQLSMMKRKNQVDVGMLIQILQWTWNSCLKTMNKKSRYTLRSRLASPCLGFVMWHGTETQPHHHTWYFLNFIWLLTVEFCTMFLVDSSFNYWSAGDLLEDFKYLHKMSWAKQRQKSQGTHLHLQSHPTCNSSSQEMSYLWRYTFSQNKRALFNRFCHILHFKQDKCEFIQSSSLLRIAKYYLYKKLVRDAYSRTGSAKLHQLHGTSWVSTDQHRSTLTVPVNNLTVKVVFIFFVIHFIIWLFFFLSSHMLDVCWWYLI